MILQNISVIYKPSPTNQTKPSWLNKAVLMHLLMFFESKTCIQNKSSTLVVQSDADDVLFEGRRPRLMTYYTIYFIHEGNYVDV